MAAEAMEAVEVAECWATAAAAAEPEPASTKAYASRTDFAEDLFDDEEIEIFSECLIG